MASASASIDPSLRIGSVTLAVGDLERSAEFYERVLGLPLIARDAEHALFGPDPEHPALALEALAGARPVPPYGTGLFHVAWLHPSREALAATVQRIVRSGWPIHGASDHGVSEAIYLTDPDGLGIEVYADRPRERWAAGAGGRGVDMVTLPLDVEDLLAQAPGTAAASMSADTVVGHVHLKVSDVPRAVSFYRDALGMEEQARLPSAAFLSAGGYHHHVGVNSWQSAGAQPPGDSAPRLRLVEFELGEADALAALEQRLHDAPQPPAALRLEHDRLDVSDPDGHPLAFVARAAVPG